MRIPKLVCKDGIEREVALACVTGSKNYNLDIETSDTDYKYFVIPDFEDLLHKFQYHDSVVTDVVDYSVHDIRRLPQILCKMNITYLETLVSIHGKIIKDLDFVEQRNKIFLSNPRALFDSGIGTARQEIDRCNKLMVYKDGMDDETYEKNKASARKCLSHSIRLYDFLIKFYKSCWDFEGALWYNDKSSVGKFIKELKAGQDIALGVEAFKYNTNLEAKALELKDAYYNRPVDTEMEERLSAQVMDLIRNKYINKKKFSYEYYKRSGYKC